MTFPNKEKAVAILGHILEAYDQLRQTGAIFGERQQRVVQVFNAGQKYARRPWFWTSEIADGDTTVDHRPEGEHLKVPNKIQLCYIKIPCTQCILLLAYDTGEEYEHVKGLTARFRNDSTDETDQGTVRKNARGVE